MCQGTLTSSLFIWRLAEHQSGSARSSVCQLFQPVSTLLIYSSPDMMLTAGKKNLQPASKTQEFMIPPQDGGKMSEKQDNFSNSGDIGMSVYALKAPK